MKSLLFCSLLILPCSLFGAANPCSTAKALTQIRPGAAWAMQGDSMDKLQWLDKKQKKPTAAEVEKAKKECTDEWDARQKLKAQARADVKNPNVSTDQKVKDLILLLDFDK